MHGYAKASCKLAEKNLKKPQNPQGMPDFSEVNRVKFLHSCKLKINNRSFKNQKQK